MKTSEMVDKYQKIISGILDCKPEDIKIYSGKSSSYYNETIVDPVEIGAMDVEKNDPEFFNNFCLGAYEVKQIKNGKSYSISTWKLYQLPHCCAFMISCNVEVKTAYRGKRIGTVLNLMRQDIGRILGYSAVLCTDISQNTHQRKLLATNGWKDIFDLVNKRTNNRVYLSVVNI